MMSTIDVMNYNSLDVREAQRSDLRGLAAAAQVFAGAAIELAGAGRRARAVTGAVPPAAADGPRSADADGSIGERAVVRRLERDGVGRSNGIARTAAAAPVA